MSTVEQHNEQLTLQKQQLQVQVQTFARLVGTIALNHSQPSKKGDAEEYRLTKKQLQGFDKVMNFRNLKTGGLVIELRDPPSE